MKTETAANHQIRMTGVIREFFTTHLILKSSNVEMREASRRIWNDEGLAKCPGHVRSFLMGYYTALREAYWNNLEWVLSFKGINYKGFEHLPPEGKEVYRGGDVSGCHVYKGTNKRFNQPQGEVK